VKLKECEGLGGHRKRRKIRRIDRNRKEMSKGESGGK